MKKTVNIYEENLELDHRFELCGFEELESDIMIDLDDFLSLDPKDDNYMPYYHNDIKYDVTCEVNDFYNEDYDMLSWSAEYNLEFMATDSLLIELVLEICCGDDGVPYINTLDFDKATVINPWTITL